MTRWESLPPDGHELSQTKRWLSTEKQTQPLHLHSLGRRVWQCSRRRLPQTNEYTWLESWCVAFPVRVVVKTLFWHHYPTSQSMCVLAAAE